MEDSKQPNGEHVLIDLSEDGAQPLQKYPTLCGTDSSSLIGSVEKVNNGNCVTPLADLDDSESQNDPEDSPEDVPPREEKKILKFHENQSTEPLCPSVDVNSNSETERSMIGVESAAPGSIVSSSKIPGTPCTPGVPTRSKLPVSSPTKVQKNPTANGEDGKLSRPKSGIIKGKAVTPTVTIPGCQRAVSVDRTKSSLSSPRTPSNTPVGALELMKLKSPADDCGGSTASTPRSSTSQRGSETARSQVKARIGSLDNARHVPGGGNIAIMSHKVDFSHVSSKCCSKDNMKHTPKGGDKKVESQKLEWKAESKIGSLNNAKHKPGGGDKKIESAKLEWKAAPKIGSLENAQHTPGGGTKKIISQPLKWNAVPKICSLENASHVPGGGCKKIESLKLDFKEKAQPKIGSKDNIGHKPGGGSKKIESQKLNFKETARPRIDASLSASMKVEDEMATGEQRGT